MVAAKSTMASGSTIRLYVIHVAIAADAVPVETVADHCCRDCVSIGDCPMSERASVPSRVVPHVMRV
jgi:hypothetical protein